MQSNKRTQDLAADCVLCDIPQCNKADLCGGRRMTDLGFSKRQAQDTASDGELEQELIDAIWTNAMSSQSARKVEKLVKAHTEQKIATVLERLLKQKKPYITNDPRQLDGSDVRWAISPEAIQAELDKVKGTKS